MGAGVASDDGETRTSVRVGGQFSSTRAELAAIAMALRSMEQTQSLVLLVDSAAALQRLAWCRSSEFRPSPRRLKDVDIMHDIMSLIRGRQDAGRNTTCVKVHGHSGDSVHSLADHLAVQGADQETEDVEYIAARPDCILYEWTCEDVELVRTLGDFRQRNELPSPPKLMGLGGARLDPRNISVQLPGEGQLCEVEKRKYQSMCVWKRFRILHASAIRVPSRPPSPGASRGT
jgi:ribonuclease HI